MFEALTAAQLLLPNPRDVRTEEKPHRQGEESTRQPNEEEKGQGVSPKIEHYTQNPADTILPPYSDLLRSAEAEKWRAEEQPGGAAARTPPTLASGCLVTVLKPWFESMFTIGNSIQSRVTRLVSPRVRSPS